MLRLTTSWTLFSARADGRGGVRGAVVLYVVVAGILWNLLLTEYSMGYTPANILLHIVVPVLVDSWTGSSSDAASAMSAGGSHWSGSIYPAAYVVLALVVLNKAGRRAPYYFLDPDSVGILVVVANIGLLAVFVLALGYGISAVGRRTANGRAR